MTAKSKKITGVYAPTVTAFGANEAIDEKGTRAFIRYLLDSGVHGLVPMGSAGEFIALTDDERKKTMEWILSEVNGKVPVYAGTGHYSTRTTIELSRHAMEHGATGLMLMPPYLLKPPKEDVLNHFRLVREAVPLPIMIYNVPVLSGVEISPQEIAQLAKEGVIDSVKWSHTDVSKIQDTRSLCGPDFSVFIGVDLAAMTGFGTGADGYIGGMPMIAPRLACQLYEHMYVKKDLEAGQKLWARILPLIQFEYEAFHNDTGQPHWLVVCREVALLRGIPVGEPRLPMRALPPAYRERLKKLMKDLGEI